MIKIAIELRANDLTGLQYISGQVNQMIQAANVYSDINSQNTGPVGVGFTIDTSGMIQQQINALNAQVTTLQAELPVTPVVIASVLPTV